MPRAPIQHPRLYLAPAAWVVVLVAVSLLNAGCANQDRKAPTKESHALLDKQEPGRVTQVQQSLMIFVDQFMPALAEGFDYIERNATAPEARAAAKARKINGALAALKNAVNPQPYAGLLDMVVMVTLLSDRASATAAKELYGPYSERLTTGLAAQRAEIWSVASRYITAEQLEELSQSIQEWQNAHPERQYLAFVRIDGFPETRQIQQDRKPARRANSVYGLLFLDPLSNLDPAVREFEMSRQLAERAFFYLQRMPLVIAWQTEQVFSQMVGAPEVQSAISSIGTFANSTVRFTENTGRFAASVESFRTDIDRLRHGALEQVEQATARQRDAAIRQATTQITVQRDAAIEQLSSAVRTEQLELSENFKQVLNQGIDRLYRRALILLCFIFAGAALYRLVFRRFPVIKAPPQNNGSAARDSDNVIDTEGSVIRSPSSTTS